MKTRPMNRTDVEMLATLHRDHPRRCTLFTVALALVRFRRQQPGQDASPAELATLTGVHYANAKKSLREVRRYLGGITQVSPGGDHSGIPQTSVKGITQVSPGGDHSGIPGGITQVSPRDHSGIPQTSVKGITQVSRGGSLSDPPTIKTRASENSEGKEVRALPNAGAREAIDRVARLQPSLERWAIDACDTYDPAWVLALAERVLIGARDCPGTRYLNSILQRWARSGECEYLAETPPPPERNGMHSTPPPPRRSRLPQFRPEDFPD